MWSVEKEMALIFVKNVLIVGHFEKVLKKACGIKVNFSYINMVRR